MARTKRVLFERLTWDDGQATPQSSADEEATAALMALGGFQCSQCKRPLSAVRGYACCHRGHCPFCGEYVDEWQNGCSHVVLEYGRHRWTSRLHRVFSQESSARGDDEDAIYDAWRQLFGLTPPARRLPGQRKAGYPAWTDEQIQSAYAPNVLPHLKTIFSPTLREFSMERLGPTLLGIVQPDIRTQISDQYHHWRDCYFCADPHAALARVRAFLSILHEGTARLRALPPDVMVRPPYDAAVPIKEKVR